MLLAGCLDKRDQGHEAFVADNTHKLFSTLKSVKANSCTHKNPKILTDGRRVVSAPGHAGSQNISETRKFVWQVCELGEIVQGDEGPIGGVAQVVCHGVKVVVGHGEEGREEKNEVQGEVEGEVEESQGQPHMCMA